MRQMLLIPGLLLLFALLLLTLVSFRLVARAGQGRIYTRVEDVPSRPVALVLGTNATLQSGEPNRFFVARMRAAAQLFHAGKVQHLLVSGDNGSDHYDEVTAMRQALIDLGVPETAITRDHAGFRTLDSVVRCLNVFGVQKPLIVSQDWHDQRALYLADHFGLEAIAFAAEDVEVTHSLRTHLREILARVKAILDVHVLGTRPRFEGPPAPIQL